MRLLEASATRSTPSISESQQLCLLPSLSHDFFEAILTINRLFPCCKFGSLCYFLYHEFALIRAGSRSAPEPYRVSVRNAYNLVVGETFLPLL